MTKLEKRKYLISAFEEEIDSLSWTHDITVTDILDCMVADYKENADWEYYQTCILIKEGIVSSF
jgi:hypothetical protein